MAIFVLIGILLFQDSGFCLKPPTTLCPDEIVRDLNPDARGDAEKEIRQAADEITGSSKNLGGPRATKEMVDLIIQKWIEDEKAIKLRLSDDTYYTPRFVRGYDGTQDDIGRVLEEPLFTPIQLKRLKEYLARRGIDPATVTIGIIRGEAFVHPVRNAADGHSGEISNGVNPQDDETYSIVHAGTRTRTIWFGELLLRDILGREDQMTESMSDAIFTHDAEHISNPAGAERYHSTHEYRKLVLQVKKRCDRIKENIAKIRATIGENRPSIIERYNRLGELTPEQIVSLRNDIYSITEGHFAIWHLRTSIHHTSAPYFDGSYINALLAVFSDSRLGLNPLGFRLNLTSPETTKASLRYILWREVPHIMERYDNIAALTDYEKNRLKNDIYRITSGYFKIWGISGVRQKSYFNYSHIDALLAVFDDSRLGLNRLGFALDLSSLDKAKESIRYVMEREVPRIMEKYGRIDTLSPEEIDQLRDDIYRIKSGHFEVWGLSAVARTYFRNSHIDALLSVFDDEKLGLTRPDFLEFRKKTMKRKYEWPKWRPDIGRENVRATIMENRPDIIYRYDNRNSLDEEGLAKLRDDIYGITQGHFRIWGLSRALAMPYFGRSHIDALLAVFDDPRLGLNRLGFELDWSSPERARESIRYVMEREVPRIMEKYGRIDTLSPEEIDQLRDDIYGITEGYFSLWGLGKIPKISYFNNSHINALLAVFDDQRLGLNPLGFQLEWSSPERAKESIRYVMEREVPRIMEKYGRIDTLSPEEIDQLRDDIYRIKSGHFEVWGLSGATNRKTAPFFNGSYVDALLNVFNEPRLGLTREGFISARGSGRGFKTTKEGKDLGGERATKQAADSAIQKSIKEGKAVKLRLSDSVYYQPRYIENYDGTQDDVGELLVEPILTPVQLERLRQYLARAGIDPAAVTIGIVRGEAFVHPVRNAADSHLGEISNGVNPTDDESFSIVHAGTRTQTIWFGELLLRDILSNENDEDADAELIFRHDARHITQTQQVALSDHEQDWYKGLRDRVRERCYGLVQQAAVRDGFPAEVPDPNADAFTQMVQGVFRERGYIVDSKPVKIKIYSIVYRAKELSTGRIVVIKIANPSLKDQCLLYCKAGNDQIALWRQNGIFNHNFSALVQLYEAGSIPAGGLLQYAPQNVSAEIDDIQTIRHLLRAGVGLHYQIMEFFGEESVFRLLNEKFFENKDTGLLIDSLVEFVIGVNEMEEQGVTHTDIQRSNVGVDTITMRFKLYDFDDVVPLGHGMESFAGMVDVVCKILEGTDQNVSYAANTREFLDRWRYPWEFTEKNLPAFAEALRELKAQVFVSNLRAAAEAARSSNEVILVGIDTDVRGLGKHGRDLLAALSELMGAPGLQNLHVFAARGADFPGEFRRQTDALQAGGKKVRAIAIARQETVKMGTLDILQESGVQVVATDDSKVVVRGEDGETRFYDIPITNIVEQAIRNRDMHEFIVQERATPLTGAEQQERYNREAAYIRKAA